MIKVDLSDVATMTPEDAYYLTGVAEADFCESGTYHIVIGSRSEIESFEFLGNVDMIQVPTLEEIQASESDADARAYYEEFYGVNVEDDHVNFGFTEEGYDVWLKIA